MPTPCFGARSVLTRPVRRLVACASVLMGALSLACTDDPATAPPASPTAGPRRAIEPAPGLEQITMPDSAYVNATNEVEIPYPMPDVPQSNVLWDEDSTNAVTVSLRPDYVYVSGWTWSRPPYSESAVNPRQLRSAQSFDGPHNDNTLEFRLSKPVTMFGVEVMPAYWLATTYNMTFFAGDTVVGSVSVVAHGQAGARLLAARSPGRPFDRALIEGVPARFDDESFAVAHIRFGRPTKVHIVRGEGVEGGPIGDPGKVERIAHADSASAYYFSDTTVKRVDSLPYHFTAKRGYENVEVRLDGKPVEDSGHVVFSERDTTEHVLVVTADRKISVPAGAEGVYQAALGVLSAADPIPAYQRYIDVAGDYYTRVGDERRAARDIADVQFLAFDPTTQFDALARVGERLNGHVFRAGPPSGSVGIAAASARSAAPEAHEVHAAAASEAADESTVMLYVNGIWSGDIGAAETTLRLDKLRRSNPFLATAPRWQAKHFYSRTRSATFLREDERQARCLAHYLRAAPYGIRGANSFGRYMDTCMQRSAQWTKWTDADLIECVKQVVSIWVNGTGAIEDAELLANRIAALRDSGHHVITVPHSQGNLVVNQAIHRLVLDGRYRASVDTACIGVVSLASPVSQRWDIPNEQNSLAPVRVTGDIIPLLGGSTYPTHDNGLSRHVDAVARRIDAMFPTSFRPSVAAELYRLKQGVTTLHFVDGSYILQPESGVRVRAGLERTYRACAVAGVRMINPDLVITRRESGFLFARMVNSFGEPIPARRLTWTSSDPSVATVSSAGLVTGVKFGTAVVRASWGTLSAAATVTVTKK